MSFNWIPVSDRLPDSDTDVLIATTNKHVPVWFGFHDGEGWNSTDETPGDVTRWAELPDPPAKGGDSTQT